MSSAPSVPGVEVGASWLGGCEHVRTAGALELLAVLHATFGPRRAELPESGAIRDAERAGGTLPEFPAGTRDVRQGDWRVAPLAPGLVDLRVEITGPTDRKLVNNALNCGAKIFMADFEDSNTPTSGNRVTGQLNVRNASRRRYRRCSPDSAASKMPRKRSATSSPPGRAGRAPARRSGTAPGRPLLPAGPFTKEYVHARRLPAGL
jgi:malate synthase